MIPTSAASTRTEPATVPAIAPPLIRVVLAEGGDGEGAAMIVVPGTGLVSDVDSEDELADALWPKGVTPGVVVVRTVLLYPVTAAHPYP